MVDGERAAIRLRCTGRHRGELLGIAASGLSMSYDAAAFLRARDGQLCEVWVLGDVEHLRSKLSPPGSSGARSG